MANILQHQYASVWNKEDESTKTKIKLEELEGQNSDTQPTNTIKDIQFSPKDFIEAINEVSNNSAPGPDGIGPMIMKNCKEALAVPLCLFWRKSLDQSEIPKIMKEAHVTPILKKPLKRFAENYRPISLISHIIKIFERIIKKNLVNFLEKHKLLKKFQHGFRKHRSCLTELIDYRNEILDAILKKKNIDVVYLDFSKAFDRVDHKVVLEKARKLGIQGKILKWLAQFLINRTQKTIVNGCESYSTRVLSGVPQGTVLGPLLFIIMLNDITDYIKESSVYSFADDTRILKTIESTLCSQKLQEDLERTYEFAQESKLQFNENKFELIKFGFDEDLKGQTKYTNPRGNNIEEKSKVKDLGITIENNLSFNEHIDNVVSKCRQISGFIFRTFSTRNINAMLTLYKSYIQPHMDYCVQLWYPHKISELQKLEGIQRTFTDKIEGLQDLNYWQRLEKLNLYSVHRRYERYIIIYIWKVLEGKTVPPESEDIVAIHSIRNGRTCKKFQLPSGSCKQKTQQHNSLSRFGSRLFNILPQNIRDFSGSVESFKSRLDKYLLNLPDEPNVPGYKASIAASSNSIIDQIQYYLH